VCRAAVAHVGIGDLLRVETSPNGQFNVTEFGTVENEAQFHAMHALSPYHNVRNGTTYPPIFITTGLNDPRVEPWQSFKMAARLQASGTPNPVLLRVSEGTGHGGGTGRSERDELLADTYTFLFAALDVPYQAIDR
jgi:prolyl oligopeptidase